MDALLHFLSRFAAEFWHILVESGVWLVVGLAFAGLIHAFVPRSFFTRHLAGKGALPILKASLLGIPMPLCSCSVIPVAAGLRRQGAGKGASAAFAISTPQTGEESIPLTWALFGPVFALARPIIAVITGFLAGILIELTQRKDATNASSPAVGAAPNHLRPEADDASDTGAVSLTLSPLSAPPPVSPPKPCCSTQAPPAKPCCANEAPVASRVTPVATLPIDIAAHPSVAQRLRTAWHHGFVTMLRDLAPWLAVGLVLAGVIGAAIPEGWIAQHVGTGLWPKVAMLFVGIPLYICATSSTPLAWSLVAAGLSPGAAIVLLLAGPATNVATMAWVVKDLGVRALVVYLAVIAAVALASGVVFDAFFAQYLVLADRGGVHAHGGLFPGTLWGWIQLIAAAVFAVMLAAALLGRYWPARSSAAPSCCASETPISSATPSATSPSTSSPSALAGPPSPKDTACGCGDTP